MVLECLRDLIRIRLDHLRDQVQDLSNHLLDHLVNLSSHLLDHLRDLIRIRLDRPVNLSSQVHLRSSFVRLWKFQLLLSM